MVTLKSSKLSEAVTCTKKLFSSSIHIDFKKQKFILKDDFFPNDSTYLRNYSDHLTFFFFLVIYGFPYFFLSEVKLRFSHKPQEIGYNLRIF